MAEQRLIDANALTVDLTYDFTGRPMNGRRKTTFADIRGMILSQPTIDPETLPLVRQLREELEREKRLCDDLQKDLAVTANERDAALERVKHYAGCWECKVREEGECAMPFFKDECSDWEWRGPQKEE